MPRRQVIISDMATTSFNMRFSAVFFSENLISLSNYVNHDLVAQYSEHKIPNES